jgi:hypothetical protein
MQAAAPRACLGCWLLCYRTRLESQPRPIPAPNHQAKERLAAKEAEGAELMAMCDQLLAQQEGGRASLG